MSKTKTICFTNNKGGSGKSTACANLAYELAQAGKKVLLIDGDMQLNLSLSFFDEDRVLINSSWSILISVPSRSKSIVVILLIIPSIRNLRADSRHGGHRGHRDSQRLRLLCG